VNFRIRTAIAGLVGVGLLAAPTLAHADTTACVTSGWPNQFTWCETLPSHPQPQPQPQPTPEPAPSYPPVTTYSTKAGDQTIHTMLGQLRQIGYVGPTDDQSVINAFAQATGQPVVLLGQRPGFPGD
jgi:hypothetical protein